MTALSPEQAAHFEKLLNEYEKMREDAQEGMKATVGDLREKLAGLVAKEDLADELAGFRLFVKRRYIQENHPEKAEKADAKTQVADAYEFQASQAQVYTTRTHSAGRAKPAQSEPVTPHDPVTGEIAAFAELSTLIETVTSAEIIEASATIADTEAVAPGASDNGSDTGAAALAPEPVAEAAKQDPIPTAPVVPLQVHRGLKGEPLTPLSNGPAEADGFPVMPDFLKRAQAQGAA